MTKSLTTSERKRRVELMDLRARLVELEDTLHAIRTGEVDALVVQGPDGGEHVYSLKGAEHPYRSFIEQMQEGAVTLDPQGTILYCNRRFAEMIHVPLQQVISNDLLTFFDSENHSLLAGILGSGDVSTVHVTLTPKNGKPFPVRCAFSPLDTGTDDVAARCLVITDLTEQHERQTLVSTLHELKGSQEALQKQYEEVLAVRSKLEQANTAKDEFLAALSHELRTPLTPVLLTANALAVDPSLPAELRGDLEMIRRNVELEARLIDDLLDLTRITRGKLQISPQPVNLHESVRLALDICQADTAAKRLRFVTNLDAKHHHVNAEAVRLQQVFWNLLRNAVKFTPGAGQITVTTKNIKPKKGQPPAIVITIHDTGIGISPSSLDSIFNAFEQGSGEITRRFGGLGLGLTITRRILELHSGTITAASKGHAKGATFTVTLPTVPAPAALPPATLPRSTPARSLRILLVEDHDDTRRNMTRLLTALRHEVVPAHDAATALKQAAAAEFDLVISDIGLPDESGLELMKKLKARHNLRGICLSGYGMEEDIARSLDAGFLEHLTKPINFQRLETAINQAATAPKNDRPRTLPPHTPSS